jgi:hypothetical protein
MTDADKHAAKRLAEAVKYVARQWGHGWPRLSDGQRQSLVRAEMLAEIHRAQGLGEAATYRELVEAMAHAAMQWEPEI